MLTHLSIRNYALIDNLSINLPKGIITITGETGAGKSIILGALKLVLGERADSKSLKNPEEKCIIEAEFLINDKKFKDFFIQNELDFDEHTIIRREIQPSGKSRAFINDSPVTLDILQSLSGQLIDIHSQFETSELLNEKFQLRLLDNFSSLQSELKAYKDIYNQYITEKKELTSIKEKLNLGSQDLEYNRFLLEELERFDLDSINFLQLEEEMNLMKNSEHLAQLLSETIQILDNEEIGILNQIHEISTRIDKGAQVFSDLEKLSERIGSIKADFHDISSEIEEMSEKLEFNPEKHDEIADKINLINSLFLKHNVKSIEDLIEIRDNLSNNSHNLSDLEERLTVLESRIKKLSDQLLKYTKDLRGKRTEKSPLLESKILEILERMGMEKSRLKIEISETENFTATGMDKINFLFSANTGKDIQPIIKAISGGERSRVMLAIKNIMAENESLPTLILDEIDTGVSGRIANEMGKLMQEMAQNMQVIVITHLPQVAAKGNTQFKVEKSEYNKETTTQIRLLTHEERIEEIAQLISGSDVTDIARQQAFELFK